MLLKDKTLYVHDLWDGTLSTQLSHLALGLKIATADPGYSEKKLCDYIKIYAPVTVIISTPCWHSPLNILARNYYSFTKVPLLYVVKKELWRKPTDQSQLDFLPRSTEVLFRDGLAGLSLIYAIYQSIVVGPRFE